VGDRQQSPRVDPGLGSNFMHPTTVVLIVISLMLVLRW
jgi:hypothetical protein